MIPGNFQSRKVHFSFEFPHTNYCVKSVRIRSYSGTNKKNFRTVNANVIYNISKMYIPQADDIILYKK